MSDPVARIIEQIIEREGGFVDHPDDRGGPTKYGITLRTLEDWRGSDLTVDDVRRLGAEEAALIYRCRYVEEPGFDRLPPTAFAGQVIDAGVMHGPGRAAVWLQNAVGTSPDGIIGPRTRAAVIATPVYRAVMIFAVEQLDFIAGIVSRDPSQAAFVLGWIRRATSHLRNHPMGTM